MFELLLQMLDIYQVPGQAFWRALELRKLQELRTRFSFNRPVLEIGCGDGAFSSLIFERIDDAIDINPRAIERAARLNNLYQRLHCVDARVMQFPHDTYRTIFANCVLEHIPDVNQVIKNVYRILAPHGLFVSTMPLAEMNRHLLFTSEQYIRLRQRQLWHINLLTVDVWLQVFHSAGFSQVLVYPYLYDGQCRLWDKLDFPGCIGYGRYTVSAALRLIIKVLPRDAVLGFYREIAKSLKDYAINHTDGLPCACAFVAMK